MTKKSRIRYDIAAASRLNVLGVARTADMQLIWSKYLISTAGVGGTRVMGAMYSGGDYWR